MGEKPGQPDRLLVNKFIPYYAGRLGVGPFIFTNKHGNNVHIAEPPEHGYVEVQGHDLDLNISLTDGVPVIRDNIIESDKDIHP